MVHIRTFMRINLFCILFIAILFSLIDCVAQNKLDKALSNPTRVTILKIEDIPVHELPAAIGTLTELKTLTCLIMGWIPSRNQ